MTPSEPQMRRLVFFCIREKPRKKVKKSKSSLLRGVNQCFGKKQRSKMKVIFKEEVLLRDSTEVSLSLSKRHTLWTMNYISLTKKKKNKQTNKNKAREKKARGKRCVISRAGIDDRFTFRCLDSSSSIRGPGIHDSAKRLKNALNFSSSVSKELQEE